MKTILLSLVCVISAAVTYGQVGINTTNPNTNAALDVSAAANKGLLIPRGDAATRTALNSNTAKGLMLYDTVTSSIWIHDGNGLPSGWHNQKPVANSTIIPYSTGNNIFTVAGDGTPATVLIPAFTGATIWPYPGPTVGSSGSIFSVILPRDGVISSVALYFNFTNGATFSEPPVVTARVSVADVSGSGTNEFVPLFAAQTSINFPATVFTGTFGSSVADMSVQVSALSRMILTIYISGPPGVTIQGNIAAAVTYEY